MSDNKNNTIFKDITPLEFNDSNSEITKQLEKLEKVVETKFGNRKDVGVMANYLSSTQLRSLYDKIKQCKKVGAIQMLYPKVVYIAARQNDNLGKNIVMEIAGFIKEIKTDEELQSFKKFMEAVVAFQKYYYPSKN
ncbi:MAG: type III-A CRISPR-associated protein Csm2 [Peptostreptococcaceae bacterium]|nr:type III-A CRISPR-associated protein Csm2 [Peptostreptococcaceae bacterium]